MRTKSFNRVLAVVPFLFACHLASAQEMVKAEITAQQKASGELHQVNLARVGSGSKLANTGHAQGLPVDNDHDPRFQKLKIQDPNYTAAMSFE